MENIQSSVNNSRDIESAGCTNCIYPSWNDKFLLKL